MAVYFVTLKLCQFAADVFKSLSKTIISQPLEKRPSSAPDNYFFTLRHYSQSPHFQQCVGITWVNKILQGNDA